MRHVALVGQGCRHDALWASETQRRTQSVVVVGTIVATIVAGIIVGIIVTAAAGVFVAAHVNTDWPAKAKRQSGSKRGR
jgi:hypothetical protein